MAALDPTANTTTTTTANDVYLAAWVSDQILDEERPYNVMRPFFRYEGPKNSPAVDFPIQADPGAATSGYTEGTGLGNTALSTDKATATATSNGMMATITDELDEIMLAPAVPHFSGVLGRSVAERFEVDATALLDDFANTTGTSGQPTTYATLLEAVNQLAQRDQTGTAVGVLDPAQWGNVMQDLGTSGAAALSRSDINIGGALAPNLTGYVGNLAGVPWFQTSLVTSSGGAVFISGVALGLYEIRPPRVETIRVPNLPALEVVATSRYGMVEIRDRAGETIISS